MTYTMSRDYDRLYDLLCGGGEALAKRTSKKTGTVKVAPVLMRLCHDGGFDFQQGWDDTGKQYSKSQFIAECTRLNLEWLAPVDIAEVIAAGDAVKEKLGQLRIRQYQVMTQWAEASEEKRVELWRRLHERTDQYLDAMEAWTTATAKHRTA